MYFIDLLYFTSHNTQMKNNMKKYIELEYKCSYWKRYNSWVATTPLTTDVIGFGDFSYEALHDLLEQLKDFGLV